MTTADLTPETLTAISVLRQTSTLGVDSQSAARLAFERALGVDDQTLITEGATLETDLMAEVAKTFIDRVDWAEVLADVTQRRR